MNNWWAHCDAFLGCNEGRGSELSRRATFLVLFSREGKPGMWLLLLTALWGLVAASAFGSPG